MQRSAPEFRFILCAEAFTPLGNLGMAAACAPNDVSDVSGDTDDKPQESDSLCDEMEATATPSPDVISLMVAAYQGETHQVLDWLSHADGSDIALGHGLRAARVAARQGHTALARTITDALAPARAAEVI